MKRLDPVSTGGQRYALILVDTLPEALCFVFLDAYIENDLNKSGDLFWALIPATVCSYRSDLKNKS